MRSLIFLNHATPQENQFTAWLAAKLSLAGYEVWCDFHRLRGGQDFWDVIEDVIRNKTFRFVAITSKISQTKKGVQKELALAVTIENRIPDFVIPIRIDDLKFDDLKISVLRKNVVDFYGNWQKGLLSLLSTLKEANAPASPSSPTKALPWLFSDDQMVVKLTNNPETLETNWFPIQSIPQVLNTVQLTGMVEPVKQTEANTKLPWFQHVNQLCGFASIAELQSNFHGTVSTKSGAQVSTIDMYKGESATFGIVAHDVLDRMFVNLVRQCWDIKMSSLGLRSFASAHDDLIWFLPLDLIPGNRVVFPDVAAKKRRKNLVGRSEKRKVYWHYGVSCHPVLGSTQRLELRSHVIFTADGRTPLYSSERMHKLRRGFCRNWWNDHFRSLLKAFVFFVAKGEPTIVLEGGRQVGIVVSGSAFTVAAPVGLHETGDLPEELESVLDESADPDADTDDDDEDGDTPSVQEETTT